MKALKKTVNKGRVHTPNVEHKEIHEKNYETYRALYEQLKSLMKRQEEETMKAAVVCANEDVQYLDYEEPIPGPGEVKVKVRASGICGSDIPRVLHNGVHFYPIVLGHEFSGDVVEIGEGVTKVKSETEYPVHR